MANLFELLPKESIILILNKFNNIDTGRKYEHPSRRYILSLYLTCSNFKWLEQISISARESHEVNETYSTFDIFGNNIGIQLTHHYKAADYPDEYLVDMISGFKYTDIRGNDSEINLFCAYHAPYNGIHYDTNIIIQVLTKIIDQIKNQNPIFYKWYRKIINSDCNNLLVQYKIENNYDMTPMCIFDKSAL
jgi:hypothetical protein